MFIWLNKMDRRDFFKSPIAGIAAFHNIAKGSSKGKTLKKEYPDCFKHITKEVESSLDEVVEKNILGDKFPYESHSLYYAIAFDLSGNIVRLIDHDAKIGESDVILGIGKVSYFEEETENWIKPRIEAEVAYLPWWVKGAIFTSQLLSGYERHDFEGEKYYSKLNLAKSPIEFAEMVRVDNGKITEALLYKFNDNEVILERIPKPKKGEELENIDLTNVNTSDDPLSALYKFMADSSNTDYHIIASKTTQKTGVHEIIQEEKNNKPIYGKYTHKIGFEQASIIGNVTDVIFKRHPEGIQETGIVIREEFPYIIEGKLMAIEKNKILYRLINL